ncbi:hypothetical protein OHA77_19815 [Streptosporangium sp. NBC_01639]|uniref:hypothetical protein n=1 Tax=Streptosporangium sp. NBC_01639 TaxID=2975948 RepID=UPI003869F183|nr:hypothetical protein OHA77_19815 [Streptosporangium sp. NBC_01639]
MAPTTGRWHWEANTDAGFFHLRIHTDRLSVNAVADEIMNAYDRLRTAESPHGQERHP